MTAWNARLETGHANIDAEHREFFRQLDGLKSAVDGGAGREQIAELIIILQKYVLGHFAREEAHMQLVQCPALHANCSAHRLFAEKLDHWLDILSMSGTPLTVLLDVHRESIAWIENHILHIDCQLRGCTVSAAALPTPPAP